MEKHKLITLGFLSCLLLGACGDRKFKGNSSTAHAEDVASDKQTSAVDHSSVEVDPEVVDVKRSIEEVAELCKTESQQTQVFNNTVAALASDTCDEQSLPNQLTCNRETDQNKAQRRYIDTVSIPFNEVGTICDIQFEFVSDSFKFDDQFAVTLNDRVLTSSTKRLTDEFETAEGFKIYDWEKIMGKNFGTTSTSEPYCAGNGTGECVIPITEALGNMSVKIDNTTAIRFGQTIKQSQKLDFNIITFADSDGIDVCRCSHNEFVMRVTIKYIATDVSVGV